MERRKVYIEKPKDVSDRILRTVFKAMRVKAKVTKTRCEIHVSTLNENGIFNLGMKFQFLLKSIQR